MLTNGTVTVYHRNNSEYARTVYPAWVEHRLISVTDKTGTRDVSGVKLSLLPAGEFSPGDYVVLGACDFVLWEDNLREFLAGRRTYTVREAAELRLPDGELHHVEAVCV